MTMRAQKALQWKDAVSILADDETRSYAVTRLRESGFTVESFASQRKAREVIADALTRLEDRLELTRSRREAIRSVRRRLELELWP